MLKSTPLEDVAVYIDYCSLYQSPRTTAQDASFTRAMAHTHLWFIHRGTRVWSLAQASDRCAQAMLERALGDMLHLSTWMLDLDKLDDDCTEWLHVLSVCKHQRQPPAAPSAFAFAMQK